MLVSGHYHDHPMMVLESHSATSKDALQGLLGRFDVPQGLWSVVVYGH
jgi:hypothetical protein